ncbi:MAG: hypothetical protein LBS30_01435 [Planctomycetota bacterium]|jgi:hypothetical protein|nr:hypothetical protein [Planctomycetota bacterium]
MRFVSAAPFLFLGGIATAADDRAAADFTPMAWGEFLGEAARSIDAIGLALIVVLIVLLAMCLDLFAHLRIGKLIPESLLNDVQEEMANGEYEKALEVCRKSESIASQIFASALSKTDYSFDRMEESMRGEVAIQGLVWRQWVGQFKIMAAVGMLLGFGGFLVETMRFVADLAGRPNIGLALASSSETRSLVYCGLFCLLVGVATALISLSAYTVASSRLEKALLEAERLGEELLDPFRPLPATQEE